MLVSLSAGPLRSAGMRHMVIISAFQARKARYFESGDQMGPWLRPSFVILVITPRSKS